MKKLILLLFIASLASCSHKLVPKPGPYFQYKERKAKEAKAAKAAKAEFDNRKN